MNRESFSNDPHEIISHALEEVKRRKGDAFDINKVNLVELEHMTGISRAKLRRYKKYGFVVKPHGLKGRRSENTVLTGYTR